MSFCINQVLCDELEECIHLNPLLWITSVFIHSQDMETKQINEQNQGEMLSQTFELVNE